MGNEETKFEKREEETWIKPHELLYNDEKRKEQLKLLEKFGRNLKICYFKKSRSSSRPEYQHWYITDDTMSMVFGREEFILGSESKLGKTGDSE